MAFMFAYAPVVLPIHLVKVEKLITQLGAPAVSASASNCTVASRLPFAYCIIGAMASFMPCVCRLLAIPAVRHDAARVLMFPTCVANAWLSVTLAWDEPSIAAPASVEATFRPPIV